ncbi:MAG: hypothetical protein KC729_15235, partial [Candidatus Eisenbacteria bacterium]|nr:hypothetical protein [Candidatus Eisenbacteria bacterium]
MGMLLALRRGRKRFVPALTILACLGIGAGSARATDPNEPNDTADSATVVGYGYQSVDTEIAPEGDVDFYRISGARGDVVEVEAVNTLGSALNGRLWIQNQDGDVLAENDDAPDASRSRLVLIFPDDTSYLIRYAYQTNVPLRDPASEERGASPSWFRPGEIGDAPVSPSRSASGVSHGERTGDDATGGYVLYVRQIAAPPATGLAAGSGFDGIVPLAWAAPEVVSLSGSPTVMGVERSTDGGAQFTSLGSATDSRFLDQSAPFDQELRYRVRIDYPDGAGSVLSEEAAATAARGGFRRTLPY